MKESALTGLEFERSMRADQKFLRELFGSLRGVAVQVQRSKALIAHSRALLDAGGLGSPRAVCATRWKDALEGACGSEQSLPWSA